MADWYYVENGQQAGPVDLSGLQQMLATGALAPSGLIFGPGLSQWTPAGQVPALATGGAMSQGQPIAVGQIDYRGVDTGVCGLSAAALGSLRATGPWVRFVSIMMFIVSGLALIGGIAIMIILGMVSSSGSSDMSSYVGLVYIALAGVYLIPGVFLHRYANSISSLMRTQQMRDVEKALSAQKSVWKFVGMAIIVGIAVYIIIIALVVAMKLRF